MFAVHPRCSLELYEFESGERCAIRTLKVGSKDGDAKFALVKAVRPQTNCVEIAPWRQVAVGDRRSFSEDVSTMQPRSVTGVPVEG